MELYNNYKYNHCNYELKKYVINDLVNIVNEYLVNDVGSYSDYKLFIKSFFENSYITKMIYNYYYDDMYHAALYYSNLEDYIDECRRKYKYSIDNLPTNLSINNIRFMYSIREDIELEDIYDKIKLNKKNICLVQLGNKKKSLISKRVRDNNKKLQIYIKLNVLIKVNIYKSGIIEVHGSKYKSDVKKIHNILNIYLQSKTKINNIRITYISGNINIDRQIKTNDFLKFLEKKNIYPYINERNYMIIIVSKIYKIIMYKYNENIIEGKDFDELLYSYYFLSYYIFNHL